MRNARTLVKLVAAAALALATFYSVTPVVMVPKDIRTQWDQIWLANQPSNPDGFFTEAREYLGCVRVVRTWYGYRVVSWDPAVNMKRLMATVSGECFEPDNAMWHIHPPSYVLQGSSTILYGSSDPMTPTLHYFPKLSPIDRHTLVTTPAQVSLMSWKAGHIAGLAKWLGQVRSINVW